MDDHLGDGWAADDPAARARLAHERHDQVIQQLFATGLALQSALPRIRDPEVHERVAQSVARARPDHPRDARDDDRVAHATLTRGPTQPFVGRPCWRRSVAYTAASVRRPSPSLCRSDDT